MIGRSGTIEGMPDAARFLWQVTEPFHALTYFAAEAQTVFEDAGLRGFWRGYFAGRAAPLGPVGPGSVTAAFFGFHPAFVARAVPDVWSRCPPDRALDARLAGVDAAVRAHLDLDEVVGVAGAVAPALGNAAASCDVAGRPMFAANRDLDEPDEPHLALWQATTLLREHRGDGHVAVLVAAGVGPCEAHVLRLAHTGEPPESIRPYRGWDEDDWSAAAVRLIDRGWLGGDRSITPAGREAHRSIEADTDRLAASFLAPLEEGSVRRLITALGPLAASLADRIIPYPNPIGLDRPG